MAKLFQCNYLENETYIQKTVSIEKNEEYENSISIEEFIKRDIQDVPKELLVPYTKPIELSLRKPTLLEKISKKSKQK